MDIYNPARNHIPSLDGVRGIAVLIVIIAHSVTRGPEFNSDNLLGEILKSGWIGVDLFFVLSGYLITSILIETKFEPNSLRNFYVKRFGRIFPLYYTVILAFYALSFIDNPKIQAQVQNFSEGIWYYLSYTSNLSELFNWNLDNLMNPTWSLSVEEQYYIIWPLIIISCSFKLSRIILIAFILFNIILRFMITDYLSPRGIYEFTFTHSDSIIMGSMLSLFREKWSPHADKAKFVVLYSGLIVIFVFSIAGTVNPQNRIIQFYNFTAIAIMFSGFIVFAMHSAVATKFLVYRPLRTVGKYSFFMYLTHLPLLAAFDQMPLPEGGMWWAVFVALFIGMMTFLGHLSWHWFEKPIATHIRNSWLSHSANSGDIA